MGPRGPRVSKTPFLGIRGQISSVTFRSCIQLAPFQHAHVEACATVLPGQNPQSILDSVKDFVAEELRRAKEGEPPAKQTRRSFRDQLLAEPHDPRF